MMVTLAKLSENDKRLIVVLLLVVILVFVIAGYIGLLIKKIMQHQGKKMDDLVSDVIIAKVITEPKSLRKFGIKKNYRQFFKEAWIPFVIMLFSSLMIILYCTIYQNWHLNIFDYENKEGFGTLLFIFDWDNAPRADFFGVTLISGWPELIHTPTWEWHAWGSYIFVIGMSVGGIWFLICVQAYIARTIQLFKLSKRVFSKSLDNYNANTNPNPLIPPSDNNNIQE